MKKTVSKMIVAPLDGSANAFKALDYIAMVFGTDHNLEVHLLHVIPPLPPCWLKKVAVTSKQPPG